MEMTLEEQIAELQSQMRWVMSIIRQLGRQVGLNIVKQFEEPAPDPSVAGTAAALPPPQYLYPQASMTYIADEYGRAERLDGPPGAPPVRIPEPPREPSIRRIGRCWTV